MTDPHDLQRFVTAQQGVFEQALREIEGGRKRGHWMWFIFPQVAGLGFSHMAQRYAIRSKAEARAYAAHPILGPRLMHAFRTVAALRNTTAVDVFGHTDAMKLRSSATLFAVVCGWVEAVDVLERFFGGTADAATLQILDTMDT